MTATRDDRASLLLEREDELAALDAAIADARSGTGRFLVIEGVAGVGKTRLLQATRDTAPGVRVLSARGTELERDVPYALVRQLFESSLAALAPAEHDAIFEGAAAAARGALGFVEVEQPSADGAFAVLHGLYWLTAALAERDPLLLAVDDLHWADTASLRFLQLLLPRLEELPVVLATACRASEARASAEVLRVVTDPAARCLNPRPLSPDATGVLLSRALRTQPDQPFVAACHEVTGGNPFLLSELTQALAARSIRPTAAQADVVREIAPERVARGVLMRLERLPGAVRSVARSLAVLGDDSDHSLVSEFAGLDVRETLNSADALRAAAILDPGVSLRFIHPLVRTALYGEILGGERAAAHVRAAVLLRGRGAPPEQIATHLLVSDPDGNHETVETLLGAGSRALASGAPQATIAYLLRALREPPSAELRPIVLLALIVAGIRAADGSVHTRIEADIEAELEANPQLFSHWAFPLSVSMALNGRFAETIPILERAIAVAVEEQAFERAFRLEAQLASFMRLPPAQARTRLARYREGIEPDSPNGRLTATVDAAWSLVHGDAVQGVAFARQALNDGKIFAEQPELLGAGWAMVALWAAGALDDAEIAATHAVTLAHERGAVPEIAAAWWLRGSVASTRGDLAAAEADQRQAMHLARLSGIDTAIPVFAGALASVLIDRGSVTEAAAVLERAVVPSPVVWFSAMPGLFHGRLLLAQGKLKQAVEQLLAFQCRLEAWGLDGLPFFQPRVLAARALVRLGEHAHARELAEVELTHAKRWGAAWPLARVYRALALTTESTDRIALLEEAVALLETSPTVLERAYALAELGGALRRAKQRAAARESLRRALEIARRCGAAGLAKHVHDELEATGERVRHYAPIGAASLTASERRVAELAASGMTNREIAQALFLTVKTIETHLGAAYGKLGINSRRLLAGALDAHGSSGEPRGSG